jgi:LmbE family N-acetylglucosaminyl deacetylase
MVRHDLLSNRHLRWLVMAPHPDDETLGAGALIAQASGEGRFAGLVYLTDGSGSHPTPSGRSGRLANVRKREAATALHRLIGNRKCRPLHLGWKDAAPAEPDDPAFERAAGLLGALCRRLRVDALAVTALHEPHCDHAAAARLAYAVRKCAKRKIIVAEYLVWAGPPGGRNLDIIRTAPMLQGRRRHALQAHRSQLTASYGPGFRLPDQGRRMPARDILYLRRPS